MGDEAKLHGDEELESGAREMRPSLMGDEAKIDGGQGRDRRATRP